MLVRCGFANELLSSSVLYKGPQALVCSSSLYDCTINQRYVCLPRSADSKHASRGQGLRKEACLVTVQRLSQESARNRKLLKGSGPTQPAGNISGLRKYYIPTDLPWSLEYQEVNYTPLHVVHEHPPSHAGNGMGDRRMTIFSSLSAQWTYASITRHSITATS